MPLWEQMVVWASKQSAGCFSWLLELTSRLWYSIGATVIVWTFSVALPLDAWSQGASSDLARRFWSWSGPLPILLACPGPFGWCLEVGRHTQGSLSTSLSRHLPQMLPCLRGPGWNIEVPCEPSCLQTGPLLEFPSTWITCGMLGPLGSTAEPSCPWIGYLLRDLPHLWGILGT